MKVADPAEGVRPCQVADLTPGLGQRSGWLQAQEAWLWAKRGPGGQPGSIGISGGSTSPATRPSHEKRDRVRSAHLEQDDLSFLQFIGGVGGVLVGRNKSGQGSRRKAVPRG